MKNICIAGLLQTPFYGSRRMAAWLQAQGHAVNRKRVQRLMQRMGLAAIYQRPRTSRPAPEHRIYPYLLRGLKIERVGQVWAADITYIPMARGFLYLVAVMDWVSRYVLAWRLSNLLDASFCIEALEDALSHGQPEIFNTDQGSQFTDDDFTGVLRAHGVAISMDGRGRFADNIFVERLWRSLKYEEVYLKAYENVAQARQGIAAYFEFYNYQRLHQALAIGIGRSLAAPPSHTTVHTGPYTAVRQIKCQEPSPMMEGRANEGMHWARRSARRGYG